MRLFYNPGALGFVSGGEYALSYTRWLVNSGLYSGALAYKWGRQYVWRFNCELCARRGGGNDNFFKPQVPGV